MPSEIAIIAKVEKNLDIPAKMRGIFPNEKRLRIHLPAGVPTPVPDYVAKYFTTNRPHVYKYANKPVESVKEEQKVPTSTVEFDPVSFIDQNYNRMNDALQSLKRKELFAVCKVLKLTGTQTQTNERIMERIVHDVDVKNEQQKEIEEHKGVKK